MIDGRETPIDQCGEIVHEMGDIRRIPQTIAAEVVIKIIEAGDKTPESATDGGETILLTQSGGIREMKVGKGLQPNLLPISPAK